MKKRFSYILIIIVSFLISGFQYFYLEFKSYENHINNLLYHFGDDKINEKEIKSPLFFKEINKEKIIDGKFCFDNYGMEDFDHLLNRLNEQCENKNNSNEYLCSDINKKNILRENRYVLNFSKELKFVSFVTSLKMTKNYCLKVLDDKIIDYGNKKYKVIENQKQEINFEEILKNKKVNSKFLETKLKLEYKQGNYYLIYKKWDQF